MADVFARAAADVIRSRLGEPATFKPASGSNVDTHVIRETEVEQAGSRMRLAEDRTMLSALRADVGLPAEGDVFTVDGTDYAVEALAGDDPGDAYVVQVMTYEQ